MKLTERTRQGHYEYFPEIDEELWRVNWKQHGYGFCGVYVVAPDNSWPSKIGISQNPVKRLLSLQTSCWRKLDIHKYCYAENFAAARKVEQKAHQILVDDGKAMLGEWFDIRPDKAMEVVEFASQIEGVEIMKSPPDDKIREILRAHNFKAGQQRTIEIAGQPNKYGMNP